MKKKLSLLMILFVITTVNGQSSGNVGINTVTPRVKLDVVGNYKAEKIITENIPAVGAAEKDRYMLLTQDIAGNNVKRINPSNANSPGIATIVTYRLMNVNRDWVEGFNTKINSTDYSLMVLSAHFDRDLIGSAIAVPTYGVKSVNNEWIIYADYSDLNTTTNGSWDIICAIYPKTYVKNFPERGPFDLGNTSTGSDSSSILP